MELVIVATLAGEESWLNAFDKGQDLHSLNANFMYRDRWFNAKEDDCAFFKQDEHGELMMHKCSCPQHKEMRTKAKTLTFS